MTDSNVSEPVLPKISLRWLIGAVTISALVMAAILQAFREGQTAWVLVTVFVAALIVPLLMYAGTFALASLFSTIGSAAAGQDSPERIYLATTEMPSSVPSSDLSVSGDHSVQPNGVTE